MKDVILKSTFLLLFAFCLFTLTSCLQDEDTETRVPVRYTVIVTDYVSGKAVNKAKDMKKKEHLSVSIIVKAK